MKARQWDAGRAAEAARLDADIVHLADVDVPEGKHRDVHARVAWTLGRISDGSLLDVGYAHGHLLRLAAATERFTRLAGADIGDWLDGPFEQHHADVRALPFGVGEFDTVTACEVIEHLPVNVEAAVSEVRRVAARRLIVTVPWCESEPLGKGHYQSFDADRMRILFPDASFTVLVKSERGTPWIAAEVAL